MCIEDLLEHCKFKTGLLSEELDSVRESECKVSAHNSQGVGDSSGAWLLPVFLFFLTSVASQDI